MYLIMIAMILISLAVLNRQVEKFQGQTPNIVEPKRNISGGRSEEGGGPWKHSVK